MMKTQHDDEYWHHNPAGNKGYPNVHQHTERDSEQNGLWILHASFSMHWCSIIAADLNRNYSYAGAVGTLLRKAWSANVSLSVMMSRTSISEKYAVKYPKRA